jgi:branched-chain amino acid transport system permease protein
MTHFLQLLIIGLVVGTEYGLLAVGFGLILQVTGRFHIAFATTYALAGYMAAQASSDWHMPFIVSVVVGILAAVILGVSIENFIYWPLGPRAGNFVLLAIFTASLGILTAGQAALNLIWISSATKQIAGFNIFGMHVGSIHFTNLQVVTVVLFWILILLTQGMMTRTALGRMIRAVRSNMTMALTVGISPRAIYLTVFAIGSALGAVGSIFATTQGAVSPESGQDVILYALTICFLAGEKAPPVLLGVVGLGLGVVASVSNLWISPVWEPVIIYGILLVYAALKPFNIRFRRSTPVLAAQTRTLG